MKALRLFGGVVFALGLFVAVFAGMPWYLYQDPVSPWWLKIAFYCVMGGVLMVLATAAAESRMAANGDVPRKSGEGKSHVLVQTSSEVPGREVREVCGMVRGHTVYAIALSKDISAIMRMLIGGELTEYAEMMGKAREIATARMIVEAEELGADAIIDARYVTASVIGTAAELLAYGTAVKLSNPVVEERVDERDTPAQARASRALDAGDLLVERGAPGVGCGVDVVKRLYRRRLDHGHVLRVLLGVLHCHDDRGGRR